MGRLILAKPCRTWPGKSLARTFVTFMRIVGVFMTIDWLTFSRDASDLVTMLVMASLFLYASTNFIEKIFGGKRVFMKIVLFFFHDELPVVFA